MWCIPELDDAYIARMEDVLATYERPFDAAEPVVCLDEKPVSLHALRCESKAWSRRANRNRVTIQWAFTRRKARVKFGYKQNRSRRSKN